MKRRPRKIETCPSSRVGLHCLTRRELIRYSMLGATVGTSLISACAIREWPLRIASNTFPTYEIFHAAAELGVIDPDKVRMIRMPSATACLHGLAAGILEGACLTLDEVITALADKLPLSVAAVLNISVGADVLLARPGVVRIEQLKGKRVGIEQTAVGAVMLDAAIRSSGLDISDIDLVYATVDKHQAIYEQGLVDALVTFEPVASRIVAASAATRLFDSRQIPGTIVDVLAVSPSVASGRHEVLEHLMSGYSSTLAGLLDGDKEVAAAIARGLSISPDDIESAYRGLSLLSEKDNDEWFHNGAEKLISVANRLQEVMLQGRLLSEYIDLSQLALVDQRRE
jgi:NitT/TauT family transport system substrate-binding protein